MFKKANTFSDFRFGFHHVFKAFLREFLRNSVTKHTKDESRNRFYFCPNTGFLSFSDERKTSLNSPKFLPS